MKSRDRNFTGSQRIIAVVGPTATGKSDLAVALATLSGAEIVSADSMQIYRFMDIGTAKPAKDILSAIPHHFINILTPRETYSAGQFARQSLSLITKKQNAGVPVIIVGGTGLYIKALEKGLVALPEIPDTIQSKLWEDYLNTGLSALYERLGQVDPALAATLHPKDRFRILRALGIYKTTGTPLSELHKKHGFRETAVPLLKIGLTCPRDILYKRIENRVDQMMAAGWLQEVQGLLDKGFDETLKPMQAIGYRQLAAVLRGKMDLRDAIMEIKKETRRLAKRQITWFRKESPDHWLEITDCNLYDRARELLTLSRREDESWKAKRP
jgi:tRNA dimethylallyltransferase